ncbi:hypothetical protein GTV32_12995 [Gordonia sp. SID5947]|uniref:hypothetical protein n=1 Tax=Gordonia sp. SID5947 TaxID=2690315 RepID=UPI00137077D4|nr:hypothetical protein [Gordonia sp. SID5947]MYR07164.1 hypothetical protein [Gordonia sp. SID5947]
MTSPRHLLPTLFLVSAGLSALILGPILRSGHLLYRDAVSTPRSFVTDPALGLGDVAPRAVPQDWVVATLSTIVDGGVVVTAITFAALTLAGVGYGRMAIRLVPSAGRSGAVAAALVAIWNPYVAERLLQGHWSLMVSYAALGWLVVGAVEVIRRPGWPAWAQLAAATACAGFTPTGSILAAIALLALTALPLIRGRRWRAAGTLCGIWLLGALPWLTATLAGTAPATTGADGFTVFGARAESGLGTFGTVLGLGGIWNADAVPASRTIWWAAVATLLLLIVVAVGSRWLWSHRARHDRLIGALAVLAGATAVVVAVATLGPVADGLSRLAAEVPGFGLFRDTQKYLALMVPFFAVAAAGAVIAVRRWVPAGFALAGAALLIVAPLPDLAWGVGGQIRPITYPADWAAVARIVPSDRGAVAVWPTGAVRRYRFTDVGSLDPLPRMVRAAVTDSGSLTVDGVVVDPAAGRGADVDAALHDGGSPSSLAALGVGWVVVENDAPPATLAEEATAVFRGADLTLYRIDDPAEGTDASATSRTVVISAHLLWSATVLASAGAALWAARRRTPR